MLLCDKASKREVKVFRRHFYSKPEAWFESENDCGNSRRKGYFGGGGKFSDGLFKISQYGLGQPIQMAFAAAAHKPDMPAIRRLQ